MDQELSWFRLICTVGPASRNPAILKQMEALGVSIFRINLSHTPLADVAPFIGELQQATRVPVGIDTEGAQIRTGRLPEGGISLETGQALELIREERMGSPDRFTLTAPEAFSVFEPGIRLNVDFDTCVLEITECGPEGCRARVVRGGRVEGNRGVAPDRELRLPPMTPKDREAIRIARGLGVQTFFFSFASDGAGVRALRELTGAEATVVSKIESHAALVHLDEILEASDAILVDRGDLSRSVPLEEIPGLQKLILRKAHQKPIPAYVATNLLESMVALPYPTRAEVNDIANTLYDGANGLVLAAETAVGRYPVQCVELVQRLVRQHLRDVGATSQVGRHRALRSPTPIDRTGRVIWFTGLSGSGKSTLAERARARLVREGVRVEILDGDTLRQTLSRGSTFSRVDILEHNERVARLCLERLGQADVMMVSMISPFRQARERARELLGHSFSLVFAKASRDVVRRRDPKGLYARADQGFVQNLVGFSEEVPYEEPEDADLVLDTERADADTLVQELVQFIQQRLPAQRSTVGG